MERCPCCNARLRERVVCSRCKSDLAQLVRSEQAAQYWLSMAIRELQAENIEQSIDAIGMSLSLKKTGTAEIFREFIIQQQCQEILDLLAQKELLAAKQRLYRVRMLRPFSQPLRQLYTFSEYLLVSDFEATSAEEALQDNVLATSWLKRLSKVVKPFEAVMVECISVAKRRTEARLNN